MKKLLLICFAFVLLLIPTIAFADMGAPVNVTYIGFVSNPNGASYYDREGNELGKIDFKTRIICHYEKYGEKSTRCAFMRYGDNVSDTYDFIELKDVTIDDLDKYKLEEKREARIIGEANIYDLPIDIITDDKKDSHVIGKIPSETDVEVQAYSNYHSEIDWSEWYYTTCNGINGWILDDNIGFKSSNEEYITTKNILSKNGLFVPVNTTVKEIYNFHGFDSKPSVFYYSGDIVEYNSIYDVANKNEYTRQVLFKGYKLFEQASPISNIIEDDIAVGDILNVKYEAGYHYPEWEYVEHNGNKGWIWVEPIFDAKSSDEADSLFEHHERLLEEAKANNYYKNEQEYTKLNYPTTIEELSESYNTSIENLKKEAMEYDKLITEEDARISDINIQENNDTNVVDSSVVDDNNLENNSAINVIEKQNEDAIKNVALIICSSLVVILTVLVIILLVNKKKK